MDPVDLIQKTVTTFLTTLQASNTTSHNGTTTAVGSAAPQIFGISSLISALLSFSALRDWLKLIVLGGIIESCRRLVFAAWRWCLESFWLTASFDEDDSSYDWIMYWLSKHPRWAKARTVDISTRSFGLTDPVVTIAGDDEDTSSRRLCYLPSFSETYSLWYKGHYMNVTRSQNQQGGYYYRTKECLQIKILARNHDVLSNLLVDAKKSYLAAQEHLISVYASDSVGNWNHVASRPKRPLNSIVLEPGIKDLLLDDARDFLDSKEWYTERGIPFRRGYLLYGAPGSGKTSMIHSLAGELGLDVYVISLSRMGLDDTSLATLISNLPEKCIALMEDIDAAFHHGLTREFEDEDSDSESTDGNPEHKEKEKEKDKAAAPPSASRITLSGLLNALDGIGAQEGRILYATTNRYHALDPALCRPGRMDLHVEFKLASKYQASELYKCFYMPRAAPQAVPKPADDSSATSAASAGAEDNEKAETDSGYASIKSTPPESVNGDLIDLDSPSLSPSPETTASTSTSESKPAFTGHAHRAKAPKLSSTQVNALAAQFAEHIPDRECSMASLQGYLMSYKSRPVEAAGDALTWVEKERADKASKGSKSGKGNKSRRAGTSSEK